MRRLPLVLILLVFASIACNLPTDGGSDSPAQPAAPVEQPADDPVSESSGPIAAPSSGELSPDQIDEIILASVQIYAARGSGSNLEPLWSGSGTIVSPTGTIITNCHVACDAPVLVILMTTTPDQPPEPRFIAKITHFDEDLDLAVLEIATDMDGNAVSPSNLPFLPIGDSDNLRLGQPIRIFGYPGVGGDTITFTSGSVSGFDSATVGGNSQRVIVKTDADIAGGNSGGTAVNLNGELIGIPTWVNPDVRDGVTIGGIGVLRPVNLVGYVQGSGSGAPPPPSKSDIPPDTDPDVNEPNDGYDDAVGPLDPGETISGYISWEEDLDVFYIMTTTTQQITATLSDIPSGTDYDLYLLDEDGILVSSEGEASQEQIEFFPTSAGLYWVVVSSYSGASTSSPYALQIVYDGGGSASGGSSNSIQITGQAIDGNTNNPLGGGFFGVLNSGVSCNDFFGESDLDLALVVASNEANAKGFFTLVGVPTGKSYAAFFVYGNDYICENDWLDIDIGSGDIDLGTITMTFD